MWTRQIALQALLDCDGGFKAKTCREDDMWYVKRDLLDLKQFVIDQTSFLDGCLGVCYAERMTYFKQEIMQLMLCPACNFERLAFIGLGTNNFATSCLAPQCKKRMKSLCSIEMHKNMTPEKKRTRIQRIGAANRGPLDERHTKVRADEIRRSIGRASLGRKQSAETQRKKIETRRANGRPWSTIESNQKRAASVSKTMQMPGYKEAHRDAYQSMARKNSKIMKDKILRGEFTPNITNSWTHWKAYLIVDGDVKRYRSTWEAAFVWLNRDVTSGYEKIRIRYELNDSYHAFIVDFVDEVRKVLYEIKPTKVSRREKEQAKIAAAQKWCELHGYQFLVVSEEWFRARSDDLRRMLFEQPQLKKGMTQFL